MAAPIVDPAGADVMPALNSRQRPAAAGAALAAPDPPDRPTTEVDMPRRPDAPSVRLAVLRLALVAAVGGFAPLAAAGLVVMHGYADVTSALVWIQSDAPGPIRVRWRAEGDSAERTATLDARAERENVVVARLTGLAPGARASYVVEGDDERREGTVRAQPHWREAKDAADITIAIGSCAFLDDDEPRWRTALSGGEYGIFDAIAAKRPDVMLWLGDNVYLRRPDFYDPAAMTARHKRQRGSGALQRLFTATSHVAIWDDHDYGPNDADGSYPLKGEALRLFTLYWANASFGLPGLPGIFGAAPYGDVDLVLLDNRYYRSHPKLPDGPDKGMFGAAQMAWLENVLLGARGRVKLVAGGSQFWNAASRYEGLYQYPSEQKRLADFLLAARIDGLIFLSGDRHFGALLRVDRPGAYPLHEFTSSPLTSRPWEKPDAAERENPQVVPGTLVGRRQFGLIRVTGPGGDRRVALESYDSAGALLWRHELRAADLRFPSARPSAR
jgi:alkaline phosphatase D